MTHLKGWVLACPPTPGRKEKGMGGRETGRKGGNRHFLPELCSTRIVAWLPRPAASLQICRTDEELQTGQGKDRVLAD